MQVKLKRKRSDTMGFDCGARMDYVTSHTIDGIRTGLYVGDVNDVKTMSEITLGSLFDGIGGFPLVAEWCNAVPLWASEIEPMPVEITKRHFPDMEHLGDITKIDGGKIPPVDIITFGSPCQDLSVAGKQKGIKLICPECGAEYEPECNYNNCEICGTKIEKTRSALFLEAVRIIKEMRNATNGIYPTFAVWENVPGAFSSHGGNDFKKVLEELCKIKDECTIIPQPPKGKWNKSGYILGDGYSLAWRTLDAQFWGVPQRRKRIYLVVDFRGERAGEILFKCKSVSRDIKQSETPWKRIAANAERSVRRTNCIAGNTIDRKSENGGNGIGVQDDVSYTLNTIDRHAVCAECYSFYPQMKAESQCFVENVSNTIVNGTCPGYHNAVLLGVYDMTHANEVIRECNGIPTLQARMGTGGNQVPVILKSAKINIKPYRHYIVRRLTPLECERLQGFPDYWTRYDSNTNEVKDTPRYKSLGNSLALPCALFVISGICECLIMEENQQ